MEMIVQSIAEEIKVVEIRSTHPKFFRCGNTFNLEVVSFVAKRYIILAVFAFEQSHNNLQELLISCKPLTLFLIVSSNC